MIKSIDHLVLTSKNIDETIRFYCDILGMELERFMPTDGSPVRLALRFGHQKINLHNAGSPYIPHAQNPVPGAVDICFLTDLLLDDWLDTFRTHKVPIENGPTKKTGATSPLLSIYVRDPDGNLIEISNKVS